MSNNPQDADRIVLSKASDDFAPQREPYDQQVMNKAHSTVWSRPTGLGRFFALVAKGAEYVPAVVDDKGVHKLKVGQAPGWSYQVSADSKTLLLARGSEVFRIRLDGLRIEALPKQEGTIKDMADLGDLFIIQQEIKGKLVLDLLKLQGKSWQRQARLPSRPYSFLRAFPEQGLLVACDEDSMATNPGLLMAVSPDGLRLLGTSAYPFREAWVHEGQVVLLVRLLESMVREFVSDGHKLELAYKMGRLLLIDQLPTAMEHALAMDVPLSDLSKLSESSALSVDGAKLEFGTPDYDSDDEFGEDYDEEHGFEDYSENYDDYDEEDFF